jgi:D-glycero-D-manno-heptose 1,7-bisphosphate phosphatase
MSSRPNGSVLGCATPRANSRRACFLDRDGVINATVWNRYEAAFDSPYRLEELRLLPGVAGALRLIQRLGFLAVVVSNQPGVAKGKCDIGFLNALDLELTRRLAAEGAHLDAVYYCLHHPRAVVEALAADCDCRKPKPGLLLRAASDLSVDLAASYMIGDRESDVAAALAAGCTPILCGEGAPTQRCLTAGDLPSAVRLIVEREPGPQGTPARQAAR